MPAGASTLYETGQEPDYTIDDIARVEPLKDGMVRLYVASEYRDGLRTEFSVRVSRKRLAEMGRMCMKIAADMHNLSVWTENEEGDRATH